MIEPDKVSLARWAAGAGENGRGYGIGQFTRIHPNPRLYKFRWQIYTAAVPWESETFFAEAPRLCTASAMAQVRALEAARTAYILYNRRHPRDGDGLPFDRASEKWRGVAFAPALEVDTDPEWQGHR